MRLRWKILIAIAVILALVLGPLFYFYYHVQEAEGVFDDQEKASAFVAREIPILLSSHQMLELRQGVLN